MASGVSSDSAGEANVWGVVASGAVPKKMGWAASVIPKPPRLKFFLERVLCSRVEEEAMEEVCETKVEGERGGEEGRWTCYT